MGMRPFKYNPIGGRCLYGCKYCMVRHTDVKDKSKRPFLRQPFVDFDPERSRYISIEFDGEMWGEWVPKPWIEKILRHCRKHPDFHFSFQTKNPARYHHFLDQFPEKVSLGASIETNRNYKLSKAPRPIDRMKAMASLPSSVEKRVHIMPYVDLDVPVMMDWIYQIQPKYVKLAPEVYGAKIPRPPNEKIIRLIRILVQMVEWVVFEPWDIVLGGTNPKAQLAATLDLSRMNSLLCQTEARG